MEVLGGRIPFVLLGTQVENSVLFDLGNEHKAAAVYDLGSKPGSFFLRLVQGILRRHQATGAVTIRARCSSTAPPGAAAGTSG